MLELLERVWAHPFTTKSDFARANADLVAVAASDGFITTKIATGLYGRTWQLTPVGLSHLYVLKGTHHE